MNGHGKKHVFRFYWISSAFVMAGYIGLSINAKHPLTWEEAKGLIGVGIFVFMTTIPVSASFWISNVGAILGSVKDKMKENNPPEVNGK